MLSSIEKKIKISVVCPTHNSARYITRAISSIFHQDEGPDQLIFCDDGSVDNTVPILQDWIQKFSDRDTEMIVKKFPHQGPGATRNHGIALASNPWIAFLDSDDTWEKVKLLRVRTEIEKSEQKNFVLHWEKKIYSDGRQSLMRHGEGYKNESSISRLLYKKNIFSTSAVVCRRELLQKLGGFDPTLPNAQDYDLWLRASDQMKLLVIPEVLGHCFDEADSISARPYANRYKSRLRVAWRHRKKGRSMECYLKFGKILFSRQWFV
tara:strand:+ start:302 stop:1096 length:795 start_codon:yes stop_codon:yes gene_type:complete